MKKKLNILIVTVCIVVVAIFFGCASIQDVVTPCYIPPEILKSAGADVPLIKFMPYTSLFDARYVKTKLYYRNLLYDNLLAGSIASSETFRDNLFSPQGLGLLLPTSMVGVLGALGGGRYIKRPEEKELEKKLNGANKKKK